jgi:hypothetical protein
MLGNPPEGNEAVGVGENPAPAIEADHPLKVGNRFALDRLAVES